MLLYLLIALILYFAYLKLNMTINYAVCDVVFMLFANVLFFFSVLSVLHGWVYWDLNVVINVVFVCLFVVNKSQLRNVNDLKRTRVMHVAFWRQAKKAVTDSDNDKDLRVNSARHQKQLPECERYLPTFPVNAHNDFNAKCLKKMQSCSVVAIMLSEVNFYLFFDIVFFYIIIKLEKDLTLCIFASCFLSPDSGTTYMSVCTRVGTFWWKRHRSFL